MVEQDGVRDGVDLGIRQLVAVSPDPSPSDARLTCRETYVQQLGALRRSQGRRLLLEELGESRHMLLRGLVEGFAGICHVVSRKRNQGTREVIHGD